MSVSAASVRLSVDRLRSWPLFFRISSEAISISDDAFQLAAESRLELSSSAAEAFVHMGYTPGTTTLFDSVHQVLAGHEVHIDRTTGRFSTSRLQSFELTRAAQGSMREEVEHFEQAITSATERLVEYSAGHLIALPMSAGWDSRLLASLLASSGIERDRVLAYTYGLPSDRESVRSKEIAESLGIRWTKIEYTPEELRTAWRERGTESFLRDSSRGASLPHIQDWYAIDALTSRGDLPPGSVVIPGHTVVSAARIQGLEHLVGRPVRRNELEDVLSRYIALTHGTLQARPRDAASNPAVRETARQFANYLADSDPGASTDALVLDHRQVMSLARRIWHQERQAKYILNSVRTYEHFGLRWDLPLHDRQAWNVYTRMPDHGIASRDWYQDLIRHRFATLHSHAVQPPPKPADLLTAPSRTRAQQVVSAARTVGHRLGLAAVHRRLNSTRVVINHPLGFHGFLPSGSTVKLATRSLRGINMLGTFSQLFLADRWIPGTRLFTTAGPRESTTGDNRSAYAP